MYGNIFLFYTEGNQMPLSRILVASLAVISLAGCGTFSSTSHPNGAVEQHKTQATKNQSSAAAAVGGAALCGAIANKTTKSKYRDEATVLAAAVCGGAAYAATRAGYESAMIERLEDHLRTIEKPGIRISRSDGSKVVSLIFEGPYLNQPGDPGIQDSLRDEISFIANTLEIFTEVKAVIATADPNDTDFKGIGYKRARNWSRQLMKEGAPGKRIQYTSLANSPRGAITQIDFMVKS